MSDSIDSYEKFLEDMKIKKEEFINWGLNNIIGLGEKEYIQIVKSAWENETLKIIKHYEKNKNLKDLNISNDFWPAIRRKDMNNNDNKKRNVYKEVYNKIFPEFTYKVYNEKEYNNVGDNVKNIIMCSRDGNNLAGKTLTTLLKRYDEKFSKSNIGIKEYYKGYSICHVFEGANNWILYRCPWNLLLVPNLYVSLTDKNSPKVKFKAEFAEAMREKVRKTFKKEIEEYNEFLKKFDIENRIKLEKDNSKDKNGYAYVMNNWRIID